MIAIVKEDVKKVSTCGKYFEILYDYADVFYDTQSGNVKIHNRFTAYAYTRKATDDEKIVIGKLWHEFISRKE
mgnify:CR=1 FL=1